MILQFGNEKKNCCLHFLNLDLNELPSICGRKPIFRNSKPVSKHIVYSMYRSLLFIQNTWIMVSLQVEILRSLGRKQNQGFFKRWEISKKKVRVTKRVYRILE